MTKGVDNKHKSWSDHQKDWQQIRDCIDGERCVKARTTEYLPHPSNTDKDQVRYDNYKLRANFFNVTGRTLVGLCGAVNRKPPSVLLDPSLEYMQENADGNGCSIQQCAKETLEEVVALGRCGLLVDFPVVGEVPITKEQEEALRLQATIITYKAEEIINWRETIVGSQTVLKMVVLKREVQSHNADDVFLNETETEYRVLGLDEDGNYYQNIYVEQKANNATGTGDFTLINTFYPRGADGKLLREIPFVFVGANNLKPNVDKSPLIDIVKLNLSHYRNSADYEESNFLLGQPTLLLTGLTQSWIDTVWKNQAITIGARAAIKLPEGGDGKFLQINESGALEKAMRVKEEQMVALGARIITNDKKGVESAESIYLKQSGDASVLATIADNTGDAYTRALYFAGLFMGATGESFFGFNDDFFAIPLSREDAEKVMLLWQGGLYSKRDARMLLRQGELLDKDRTDEEIDDDIDQEQMNTPNADLDEDEADE